jgi:hypothetical protein
MYFLKFWRKVDAGIKLRRRKDLLRLERRQKRMEARAAAEAASARRVEA